MHSKGARVSEQSKDALKDIILAIGRDPWLRESQLRLVVESNTGHEEGWLREVVSNMRNITVPYDPQKDARGLNSDNGRKMHYQDLIRKYLNTDRLVFLENFIVLQHSDVMEMSSLDDIRRQIKHEFVEQLRRCQLKKPEGSTPTARSTLSWWGKCDINGKFNPEMKDDLPMGVGMGLYSITFESYFQWVR